MVAHDRPHTRLLPAPGGARPVAGQQTGPCLWRVVDGQRIQFVSQATHLWHSVQAEQLPQLAGRLVAPEAIMSVALGYLLPRIVSAAN